MNQHPNKINDLNNIIENINYLYSYKSNDSFEYYDSKYIGSFKTINSNKIKEGFGIIEYKNNNIL